jgi:hypothetical protein
MTPLTVYLVGMPVALVVGAMLSRGNPMNYQENTSATMGFVAFGVAVLWPMCLSFGLVYLAFYAVGRLAGGPK